jgi:hypothetical protein
MVVSVLQRLDSDALDLELSLCLHPFFVVIERLNFFIEAFLELFRQSQNVAFEDGHGFRRGSSSSLLSFLLFNKIILSVNFKLICFSKFADLGGSWFD